MEQPYYVYVFLREDRQSPYYVGKGKENRCYKKGGRNTNPPKDTTRIQIIKDYLTEGDALELERLLILMWGVKGEGVLRNTKFGGAGNGGGYVMSEEQKDKLRRVKRTPDWNRRNSLSSMGKQNTLGLKHSDETKEKIRQKALGRPSPRKGVVLSEETKKRISESKKGGSSWNKGRPMSEASKQKLRDTLRAKKAKQN